MYNPQLREVKKRKSNFPWVIFSLGFFVVSAIGFYFAYPYLNGSDDDVTDTPFTICTYDISQTQNTIEELSYTDIIEMNDYLLYGETLNLYANTYHLGENDYFIGKTVVLKNVCDGYEWVYMLESYVDNQIPLELLPNGFYEVYIVDNLIQKRLVSSNEIDEIFYPVNRDGTAKTIELLAQKDLSSTDERTIELNQNYLYINVKDSEPEERVEVYDIVLDGAHSTYVGNSVEKGRSAFNMIEANETVRMAILVQEELEVAGLKVYMTRDDSEDVIDLYGEDGRLYNAYQSNAKYYVEFNMIFSNLEERNGAIMSYSRFSSNRFATTVFKSYINAGIISAYGNESSTNIAGVKAASLYEGYDSIPVIRESGGRILGAGTMSEASQTNAFFNAEERFGIQTISIDMIHISNENDVTNFVNNEQILAKAIAQGIIEFLRIEEN